MNRMFQISVILLIICAPLSATDYTISETQSLKKIITLQNTKTQKEIIVDNVFGYLKVYGHKGNQVLLSGSETYKAESREKLLQAKKEAKLSIKQEGDKLTFYVDGSFRKEDGKINWCDDLGYIVKYDLELKIPYNSNVVLKTVLGGNIYLSDLKGNFKVHNVNGKIEMRNINGSGKVNTVNGEIKVWFKENPKNDCSFKTINGNLKIYFKPSISADFYLKTRHGKMLSDFPFAYLPGKISKTEKKNGKYIYNNHGHQGIRIAQGGPTIKLATQNGSILICKNK